MLEVKNDQETELQKRVGAEHDLIKQEFKLKLKQIKAQLKEEKKQFVKEIESQHLVELQ